MVTVINFTQTCKICFAECLSICDPYICWPTTPAGQNASMPCPPVKGRLENGKSLL